MINYSKDLLKNFKLLRDNNISRKRCLVVLDITPETYRNLYRMYSKRGIIEHKYVSSPKWINEFNSGDDLFKIVSRYSEITSIAALEIYFRNQFVALELNETVDKSMGRFIEWLTDEFITKHRKLNVIAEENGYTLKALRAACNKFGIRRREEKRTLRKISERNYVTLGRNTKQFLDTEEKRELIRKAYDILSEDNDSTELYKQLNVSPRFAKRLYSDFNILKANKVPYDKMIELINEGRLTLREIDQELKLPKLVKFYINKNIFASLLINRSIDDIIIEENRKCVYPTMCGDNTYLIRVKGRANVRTMISVLTTVDDNFVHDLEAIKAIIEHKDPAKVIEVTGLTEEELKSLMTKYYIDEYKKGEE